MDLLEAGANVIRINMSHGDQATHERTLVNLKQASQITGKTPSVFIDLQGPKIRLGKFENGPITVVPGDGFTITTQPILGDRSRCSTTFSGLPHDVSPGDPILIDDGNVTLRAVEVRGSEVHTEVVIGGVLSDHKGINLPGVAVNVPAMSDKDVEDLRWGLAQGVDMVALSFVRNGDDVKGVHAVMDEVGVRVPVIAKIEKPQALENLTAVINSFDAFMVARGDLGVELPFEDVPLAQKRIIYAARIAAKPVIVATQMLESMMGAPRPTRAEASDVATAVMQGADAVMLSGETAVGAYPVESVAAMASIISAVEEGGFRDIEAIEWDPSTTPGAVAWGAGALARHLQTKYIVGFSMSGDTARRLARLRAQVPILCFTPRPSTKAELEIVWGMTTFVSGSNEVDTMMAEMDQTLVTQGFAEPGDRVVVVYGTPMGQAGWTNTLHVHQILSHT